MSPKKTQVVAIQHLAFEDLGSFEAVLREQDMDITHLQAGVDDAVSYTHLTLPTICSV